MSGDTDTTREPLFIARLGYTQKLILRLLASGPKSAQHLEYDWPGLTQSSARSAVMRLANRGLVDVARWDDYGRRTYCLTDKGAMVERMINLDPEDDDVLAAAEDAE